MAYPRTAFIPSVFVDVPDPNSPPPGALEADADELNKFGTAIRLNREGLHLVKVPLNLDEFDAHDGIDKYPVSSESTMVVTHTSWPEIGGTVTTHRDRGSIGSSALIQYDWQEFKPAGNNKIYRRYALINSQATWLPNQSYVANAVVQPATKNGHFYRCIVGGISKATEPVWPTTEDATVTETDPGGTNPTVSWIQEGTYWSPWVRELSTEDTPASMGMLAVSNPTFTGTLTGVNINTSGIEIQTPSPVSISAAGNTLPINATNLYVTSTVSNLTLTGTPIIPDGVNGQFISITNVGANTFTLTNGDNNNLRMPQDAVLTTGKTLKLVFSTALSLWLQVGGSVGFLHSTNPVWSGVLSGTNLTQSGNVVNTPSTAQAIAAASNVISVASKNKLISNTTGGPITLTSAPTIADGTDGQEVRLLNTGTQNIVLQDQGTLASSNLRLQSGTVILSPLDSIELLYSSAIGDWVQVGNVVAVV